MNSDIAKEIDPVPAKTSALLRLHKRLAFYAYEDFAQRGYLLWNE